MPNGSPRQPVVVDINVLVGAFIEQGHRDLLSWPSPPPTSPNPDSDCMGILVDGQEFSLWLSPHILLNLGRILAEKADGTEDRVRETLEFMVAVAKKSDGGVLRPDIVVTDCVADYEDNRILELALACQAVLIVSNDPHLLDMSPWKGTVVLSSIDFAKRVDVMRRSSRRR